MQTQDIAIKVKNFTEIGIDGSIVAIRYKKRESSDCANEMNDFYLFSNFGMCKVQILLSV